MEAKENNEPKKGPIPQQENKEKEKPKDTQESQNMNIYEQYQKEKENKPVKDLINNNIPSIDAPQTPNSYEKGQNIKEEEKEDQAQNTKRRRRGKDEINDRKYQCPDCEKCYLSGPALTTHRKNKHEYGVEGEKTKRRGRPKKEGQSEGGQNALIKFNNFFNDEQRKRNEQENSEQNKENNGNENNGNENKEKEVELSKIKNILVRIFEQCKEQLFKDIDTIDKYSFYNLIIENWEKEEKDLFPQEERTCYSAQVRKGETPLKINAFNVDQLFFNYLKEFAKKVNNDYLWFMIKFIVLFRECINLKNKDLVNPEIRSEKKNSFSQIYNAETVPEICNYFFLDFLLPYNNYGLNKDELIELVQHFCYWLYTNQYTQSHLTLLEEN